MFGRKRTTVGLDIGSGLIKLVVIQHGGGEPVLTKVAFTSVVDDAIVEGEVMDPGIVAEAIKGLMSSAGIKPKQVVTAVGGRDVIIKKITMDRMKEAEAREVIRWEAEQHVPFDMENVELDFQILDPDGDGLQMTVLLVAAKRELVENKLALLAEVGLEPSIIDVDAFALHNAFELNYPEAMRGVVGLVNIGHETDQREHPGRRRAGADPRHPGRHPPLPGGPAARARHLGGRGGPPAAGFGDDGGAGAVPRDPGRGAGGRHRARRGVPAVGPPVRQRVSAGLYTTGGGARIPGLNRVLADRLRLPVQLANPIERLRVADGVLRHDEGRRGGTAADAADRPRAPFGRLTPGVTTP